MQGCYFVILSLIDLCCYLITVVSDLICGRLIITMLITDLSFILPSGVGTECKYTDLLKGMSAGETNNFKFVIQGSTRQSVSCHTNYAG